jgi:hypothetical protein
MKPNVCDDDEVENDVDINIFLQTISEMKTK